MSEFICHFSLSLSLSLCGNPRDVMFRERKKSDLILGTRIFDAFNDAPAEKY